MAGTLAPFTSYGIARSFFHRLDPDYLCLERSVLEHQSYQRTRSASNRVYRLLFESGRSVLGEAVRRIASCGRSDHGARMAHPEAACARVDLRRSQIADWASNPRPAGCLFLRTQAFPVVSSLKIAHRRDILRSRRAVAQ